LDLVVAAGRSQQHGSAGQHAKSPRATWPRRGRSRGGGARTAHARSRAQAACGGPSSAKMPVAPPRCCVNPAGRMTRAETQPQRGTKPPVRGAFALPLAVAVAAAAAMQLELVSFRLNSAIFGRDYAFLGG